MTPAFSGMYSSASLRLHPEKISNIEMGYLFEELIRRFSEISNETGGMLALTEQALKGFNPSIRVELFGQELNGESFGICKSDMLVTGHDPEQIAFGNTLTHDAHKGKHFHYMLCNPPYGVDWKKYQNPIKDEAERLGKDGRFGAGLPRISDGQLLFLQRD